MTELLSREAALASGLKHYYTGIPCKNGHYSKRMTSNYVCLECIRTVHFAKRKALMRNSALKRYYGITEADYEGMLRAQDNACAICRSSSPNDKRGKFHVDHCHTTKRVRGLLCQPCNMGIGLFRESPESLQRAVNYLSNKERD